jgi:hypothetical protein
MANSAATAPSREDTPASCACSTVSDNGTELAVAAGLGARRTLYVEECRGFAAALPSAGAWGPFEAPM